MKKILLVMLSFLLFGFTPEYYTEENTDILDNESEQIILVDKNKQPITGTFIRRSKENGNFITITYKNGKASGLSKYFSEHFKTYIKTNFNNGKEEGVQRFYSLDNITFNIDDYIVSDNFSDIMLAVKQMEKLFNSNGYLSSTIEYKEGRKDGKSKSYYYDKSNSRIKITPYSKGLINGIMQEFIDISNDYIYIEIPYIKNKKEGIEKKFINGVLLYEIPYSKGLIHGQMKVYKQGTLIGIIPYVNDELNGLGFIYDDYGFKLAELIFLKNNIASASLFDKENIIKIKLFFSNNNLESGYCSNNKGIKIPLSDEAISKYIKTYDFIISQADLKAKLLNEILPTDILLFCE